MENRIVVAYALIAITGLVAAYLLYRWRNHEIAERQRLSGKHRR